MTRRSDIKEVAESVPFDNSENDFIATDVQEAIEEVAGQSLAPSGKLLDFEFFSSGTSDNKWMNVGHPSVTSNDVPYVAEWAGRIIGLSYSNENSGSNTDLEIYVNESLVYTWQIRNKKTAWKVLNEGMATVSQGARISAYAKAVTGIAPKNIFGEIVIQVTTLSDGEGGTA